MIAKHIAVLALLLVSSRAEALCRDDLKDLKPRIDRMKTIDQARYHLAFKWWSRAHADEPASESACANDLAKARKALVDPLPEVGAGRGAAPVGPVTKR